MIPKSFKLMGHTIKVKMVPDKDWVDDETVGFWNAETMCVSIREGFGLTQTQQIFCHELTHAILDNMGEYELNGNEKFVDVFGSLLHQAWTSCK